MEDNFQNEVSIDKFALDEECSREGTLYWKWAKLQADQGDVVRKLKEKLEVVDAEIEKGVRFDPKAYGIDKITESAVSMVITLHPTHREVMDAYIDAKYTYDLYVAACRSLDKKTGGLQDEVRLYLNNYYKDRNFPEQVKQQQTVRYEEETAEKLGENPRLSRRRRGG
jgi:hypothetical protein